MQIGTPKKKILNIGIPDLDIVILRKREIGDLTPAI
jgi:hypothetical protein